MTWQIGFCGWAIGLVILVMNKTATKKRGCISFIFFPYDSEKSTKRLQNKRSEITAVDLIKAGSAVSFTASTISLSSERVISLTWDLSARTEINIWRAMHGQRQLDSSTLNVRNRREERDGGLSISAGGYYKRYTLKPHGGKGWKVLKWMNWNLLLQYGQLMTIPEVLTVTSYTFGSAVLS